MVTHGLLSYTANKQRIILFNSQLSITVKVAKSFKWLYHYIQLGTMQTDASR